MRIFNQIEEIVKSAKSAKSSNELLSVGKELANLAEFQAWNLNFKEDPYTTVFCLKLMKKAINQARFPSYGWLS